MYNTLVPIDIIINNIIITTLNSLEQNPNSLIINNNIQHPENISNSNIINDKKPLDLVGFATKSLQDFTKLLLLLRLLLHLKFPPNQIAAIPNSIMAQDAFLSTAADQLYHAHNSSQNMPIYDIYSALDVLLHSFSLPLSIKNSHQDISPLSSDEILETSHALQLIILSRLATAEYIPSIVTFVIEGTAVVFNVLNYFEISLSTLGENDPWHIVDLKLLIQSNPQAYDGLSIPLYDSQLSSIADKILSILSLNTSEYNYSLMDVFEYLIHLGAQLKLETLFSQADFLSRTRWKSAISADFSSSDSLRIYYWVSNPDTKRYIQFKIIEEVDFVRNKDLKNLIPPRETQKLFKLKMQAISINSNQEETIFNIESTKLDNLKLDIENVLLFTAERESQLILDRISNLMDTKSKNSVLKINRLSDAIIVTYTDFTIRIFVDYLHGKIRGSISGKTSTSLAVFENRLNRDNSNWISAFLYLRYENVLDKIKSMAKNLNFRLVEKLNLDINIKTKSALFKTPLNQAHIAYLGLPEFPGQFLAICVAGSSDWDLLSFNCQEKILEQIDDIAEARIWIVNTTLSETFKSMFLESCEPLYPCHIFQEDTSHTISAAGISLDALSKIYAVCRSRFAFREFITEMSVSDIKYSFVGSTCHLQRFAEKIDSTFNSSQKVCVPIDGNFSSHLFLYLKQHQDLFKIIGYIRIYPNKLPPFKDFASDNWKYDKFSGILSFSYNSIQGFLEPLNEFLKPFLKICNLARKIVKHHTTLQKLNVRLISFDSRSIELNFSSTFLDIQLDKNYDYTIKLKGEHRDLFFKRICDFGAKFLNKTSDFYEFALIITSILSIERNVVHLYKLCHCVDKSIYITSESFRKVKLYLLSTYVLDIVIVSNRIIIVKDGFDSSSETKWKPIPEWSKLQQTHGSLSSECFILPLEKSMAMDTDFIPSFFKNLAFQIDQLTILSSCETILAKAKTMNIVKDFVFESGKNRIGWTTENVRAVLSLKPDQTWLIMLVLYNSEHMKQVLLSPNDVKPLSESLTQKLNSLKPGLDIKDFFANLLKFTFSSIILWRDFIQVAAWEKNGPGQITSIEWVLDVSNQNYLEYVFRNDKAAFQMDPNVSRVSFVIKFFSTANALEMVYIPLRYNYDTGVISLWRSNSENDYTGYIRGIELSEKLKTFGSAAYLSSLSLVERVLSQASAKDVPINLGGPGKLFVVIKHLCSRPVNELKQFVL